LGGQDAHPTRKSTLCGTGKMPVLDNNDATSQIDRTIIISFTKINIAAVLMTHPTLPVCADGAPYIDRINRFSIIKKG